MNDRVHQWTKKDKSLYALSMIPFLLALGGAFYVLVVDSPGAAIIFAVLYLMANIFQAGACVGCPYRGSYCPAIFGVYAGNLISTIVHRNRVHEERFFAVNAKLAEAFCLMTLLFPLYRLFLRAWYYPLIYLALVGTHLALFMPVQCEKCGYNNTCPGGVFWRRCQAVSGKKNR
ncbi:MAG: hypothetical protein R6U29_02185 [Desulfosudaceae bacterium]